MAHENEAHRKWDIRPCDNPAGWHTVGYEYDGLHGTHQGTFIPVHHWKGRAEAEAYQGALLAGMSRDEAKQEAIRI